MKTLKNTLVLTALFAITYSLIGCTSKCDNNGLRDRLCLNNFLSIGGSRYPFTPEIPPGDFKTLDPIVCTDFLAAAGIVSTTSDFFSVTDQEGAVIFDGDVIGGVVSRGPQVFQTYATKTVGSDNAGIDIRVNNLQNIFPYTPYCAAGALNGVLTTPLGIYELHETLRVGSVSSTSTDSVYQALVYWDRYALFMIADGHLSLSGTGSKFFRFFSMKKSPSIP